MCVYRTYGLIHGSNAEIRTPSCSTSENVTPLFLESWLVHRAVTRLENIRQSNIRRDKKLGFQLISFNVLKKCFSSLCEPLKYLFNLSIEKGIFPDDLKIAKVTPIYKTDNKSNLGNYRAISVLSCLSKILERTMYNRLYQYLTEMSHNLLLELCFVIWVK